MSKTTFEFEGFPVFSSVYPTWLHFPGTMRRPDPSEPLPQQRVDGKYITPGSIVFSIPPKPKEPPSNE